jgi:hypothetical protein
MPEVIVTISRTPGDRTKCVMDPNPFRARQNDTVTFKRADIPEVLIRFRNGSPFGTSDVQSGSHKAVTSGTFEYDVSWVDPEGKGSGNGSGEVKGG